MHLLGGAVKVTKRQTTRQASNAFPRPHREESSSICFGCARVQRLRSEEHKGDHTYQRAVLTDADRLNVIRMSPQLAYLPPRAHIP